MPARSPPHICQARELHVAESGLEVQAAVARACDRSLADPEPLELALTPGRAVGRKSAGLAAFRCILVSAMQTMLQSNLLTIFLDICEDAANEPWAGIVNVRGFAPSKAIFCGIDLCPEAGLKRTGPLS